MSTQWYAERKGWTLGRANVVVEGNLDVRYFCLADKVHFGEFGHRLLTSDFRILSSGTGDAGGTDGVFREFLTLFNLSQVDLDANGKRKYRIAALFDDDGAGRAKGAQLLKANRTLRAGRDVFMLRRRWPERLLAPDLVEKYLLEANAPYGDLPCEIEDLLGSTLVELFLDQYPQFSRRRIVKGDGFHVDWGDDAKHALVRFAEEFASPSELQGLSAVAQGLRHFMGAPRLGV
ncbi:hypothetical protein [Variovorax guangxiensis]|uniref:hypothetical protein n=1 Tax=Variovorax guangxiensis TaxID=1775474 RepID=UPI002861551A|nr:hypothetical protein [Variovorax guangxiensis]MDR6855308.1 hypothetical protein [Variovorax guangxiensis]